MTITFLQSFMMKKSPVIHSGWEFKEYGMKLRQALELEDYIKELRVSNYNVMAVFY